MAEAVVVEEPAASNPTKILSGNGSDESKSNGHLPDKKDAPQKPKSARDFVGQKTRSLSGNSTMPDKNLPDKDAPQSKRRERKTISLPDKKEDGEVSEKRGWIEYAKRGTKNPKRYAYRRRWVSNGAGGWVKSRSTRLYSIPPLTEEDYVKRIKGEGRDVTTGRRKRNRGD